MSLLLKVVAVVVLIAAAFVIWAGFTSTLGMVERILVLGVGALMVWGATRLQRRASSRPPSATPL